MFRKWKDNTDDEYARVVRKQVEATRADADKDGVVVPLTLEDYCIRTQPPQPENDMDFDFEYDYDYGDDSEDEDDFEENAEDSGQGEN